VVHFSRDPATGALGFQDCIEDEDTNLEGASCANAPGLANPKGIAVSGTSAYVGSGDDDAVAHLSLDPGTGALGFVDCIEDEDNNSEGASCTNAPGLDGALGVALSDDGSSVYVAGFFDDAVTHFSRNLGTGALGFQDCVEDEDSNLEGASCANAPGLDTPRWIAVSGDGASTYVASASDDAVVNFSRNPGTGALGFAGCIEDEDSNLEGASCANAPGLDGPQGVALSGDGASVYVASGGDDAIVHLSRETPPPPPPPQVGEGADTSPPDTAITKRPKDKTKKKQATFEFTSSEPGSSFQCAVDGQALEVPCTSPYTVKVNKGKHTFQVRATDPAGNADTTPASDAWKVKKKRKK
jgi:hypothetical protein